jgi:hypothetical protein
MIEVQAPPEGAGLEILVVLPSSYIREAPSSVHQQPTHTSHVLLSILMDESHPAILVES